MVITNFFSSYFFPPFSSSSTQQSMSTLNSQNGGDGNLHYLSNSLKTSSMISDSESLASSIPTTTLPPSFYDPQTTITTSFPSTTPVDSTSVLEGLKSLLIGISGGSTGGGGTSTTIDNLEAVLNCSGVRAEDLIVKIMQQQQKQLETSSLNGTISVQATAEALQANGSSEITGNSLQNSLTELYFAKESSSTSYSASSSLSALLEKFIEQLNPQNGTSGNYFCPSRWYGLSCWRETAAGHEAVVSCPSVLNSILYDTTQNASRQCHPNGTWAERANYDRCMPLTTETETTVPSLENIYAPYILYIGYIFSLLALTVALFILLYFKDLRCVRNTIHSNLMITYFLMAIFWIIMDQVQTNTAPISRSISCYMEIGFRYLLATNFFWMFVEGLYLYLLVVKTFSIDMIRTAYYFLIGWGLPAVVILIWVVVKRNFTRTNAMLAELSNSTTSTTLPKTPLVMSSPLEQIRLRCPYMTVDEFDYFYKVPVLIVLFVNIFFLAKIMWLLIIKLRSAQQNQLASTAESKQYRKAAKALLVLIPLLGLGYVLLLVTPTQNTWRFVFKVSQAVLTSTQGFTVAVLYCFCNGEVRNSVRHHLSRYRVRRTLKVGGDYPTPTNHAYWRPHRCHSASSASTTTTTTGTNGAGGGGGVGGGAIVLSGGNSRRKHYHFGKLLSADSAMSTTTTHNGRNVGGRSGSSGSNHFTFAATPTVGNGTLSTDGSSHKKAAKSCSIGTNGSGGGTPKKGGNTSEKSLGAGGPRFSNASDSLNLNAKSYYCPRSPREGPHGGRSRGDSCVSFTTTSSYVIFSTGSGKEGQNGSIERTSTTTTLATPFGEKTTGNGNIISGNNSTNTSDISSSSPKAIIHLGEPEGGGGGTSSLNDTFSTIYGGLVDYKSNSNSNSYGYQSVPTTPPPGEDLLVEEAITIELQPML